MNLDAIPDSVGGPAPLDLETVLTPEWVSAALAVGSGSPVEVTAVREVWRLDNMAIKVRFEVDYAEKPENLGAQFCLKGIFGESKIPLMATKVSAAEVSYYRSVAPSSAVRVPTARYTGISPETGRGVLIMDDIVAQGGRFLTALEPYSPEQAAGSLQQLATLHSETWGGTGAAAASWGNRLDELADESMIPLDMLQTHLDGERGHPLPTDLLDAQRLHTAVKAVAMRSKDAPQSLVHGDAHAGNIYLLDGPSIIDWQLLQVNSWALDVSYHLGAALSVEDRRASEEELLRTYLADLAALGVDAPSWDDAWLAYRLSAPYGYYLWAVTRFVAEPIMLEFVKRLGTAVADHDSYGLLGV